RRLLGWSQQRLAEQSGLSLPAIQILESGRGNPAWSTVVAVAGALGLEVGISVRPPEAHELVRIGAPLSGPGLRAGSGRTLGGFQKWFELACRVAARASALGAGREREALAGLFMAVRDHYPSVFARLVRAPGVAGFTGSLEREFPADSAGRGRMLKLRRLALQRISQWL
ncbi:MAG: helix-turn-helix domain-containing protein, partial [Oligoflexia bacterium]